MAFLHSFTVPDFLEPLVSLFGGLCARHPNRCRAPIPAARGRITNSRTGFGGCRDFRRYRDAPQRQCRRRRRIIAYVVSGVGFLGAGVIMKQGSNVWGLNTAATLWCSAGVGACAGADLAFEAIALTGFVLAGNTLLRPLVNAINRAPIDEAATEAIYEVRVTTGRRQPRRGARTPARRTARRPLSASRHRSHRTRTRRNRAGGDFAGHHGRSAGT